MYIPAGDMIRKSQRNTGVHTLILSFLPPSTYTTRQGPVSIRSDLDRPVEGSRVPRHDKGSATTPEVLLGNPTETPHTPHTGTPRYRCPTTSPTGDTSRGTSYRNPFTHPSNGTGLSWTRTGAEGGGEHSQTLYTSVYI